MVGEASDRHEYFLATLPPSKGQTRLALGIAVTLVIVFGITAPFANIQLPYVGAFVPTHAGICVVNDLITSALLFAQFAIVRRRGLLVLAIGFLYTALILIPYVLTFPGAVAPTGLLGAGLQSTAWLYYSWKVGLPLAVIVYVLLKDADGRTSMSERSPRVVILWSIAIVIAMVSGLTWIVIAGEGLLPRIMHPDGINFGGGAQSVLGPLTVSLCAVALTFLWIRRNCVLDLWLMVLTCTLTLEVAINTLLADARFDVGWYGSRAYALAASIIVLLVLLSETTTLYANLARANTTLEHEQERLAHSNLMLQRERDNKLMSLQAVVASISHEIKQPLSAIAMHAGAARRFLNSKPPDLGEVQSALTDVVSDSHRTGQILDNLRHLFGKGRQEKEPIDVNGVIVSTLQLLRGELTDNSITPALNLASELPLVTGQRSQFQEVLLNLFHNAIEAMAPVKMNGRALRVRTKLGSGSAIVMEIEDSGPGIDPERLESIFEAFVTTKPHGMGLGLAICRAIIERHGGKLTAASDGRSGALFQIVLPITATEDHD